MREIKFRAWNKERKRFDYYDLIKDDTSYFGDCVGGYRHKHQYILMQYTGLHDKNGKEIYEGDILKASWGYQGEVKFDWFIYANLECTIADDVEVIGNIYENPELLKENET